MTVKSIFISKMTNAFETSLSHSDYANWIMDNITLLTYPKSQATSYLIEAQSCDSEKALFYKTEGTLLLTKDITNADDTIWPDVIDLLNASN